MSSSRLAESKGMTDTRNLDSSIGTLKGSAGRNVFEIRHAADAGTDAGRHVDPQVVAALQGWEAVREITSVGEPEVTDGASSKAETVSGRARSLLLRPCA